MATTQSVFTQGQTITPYFASQERDSSLAPKSVLLQEGGSMIHRADNFSHTLLEEFSNLGDGSLGTSFGSSLARGALNLVGDIKSVLLELHRLELKQGAQDVGYYAPGVAMRSIASVGSIVSAATGVIDVAREFRKEFIAQETLYPNTLKTILKSVGQTATGYAAGVGTASFTASMLTGVTATTLAGSATVAAAPVILGVTAGLAATAAVNSFFKWLD